MFLVAAMAVSMIGCGNDDSQDNQGSNDNKTPTTESANDGNNGGDVEEEAWAGTITVWSPQEDQDSGWLQAQCDAFNAAHPNWDITFTYGVCGEDKAKELVTQDVENAADVFMMANDHIPELVAAEALAKLGGDYLGYVTTTNSDSIVNSVTYQDAVYGLPYTSNTWFMYYDKSVFTEDDIKSLDTMLEKGKVSFPLGNSWYIQAFYVANGCTLYGDGTDEAAGIDFGGEKAVAVTNYLVDLAANPNFVNDEKGEPSILSNGASAFFSGSWNAEAVREILGDNMGVAALPKATIDGNEVQLKSFMGSKALGVNANTENMQVAMSLAAYLASEEAQLAHYEMRSILPSNVNIAVEDDIATAVTNVMKDTSITQPLIATMSRYWNPAENMGKAIVAGEVTHDNAEQKTEDMNTAMNTDIAE
ncbi:MAG: extracellular solute-binding protein [Lachnospiraceae bacterium]|nr:extracellular solute-binding protein [Lachnospiraceae bacterium]